MSPPVRYRPSRVRRGIYLVPTLFTLGNLFCGQASLFHAAHGRLETAAWLIVIAAVLDGLDGRIARLTGTTSDFGLEFDSLADMVSFGVAPAMLAYQWALAPHGRVGWAIGFVWVVCAATRLARFNIKRRVDDSRFFAGLPSPMAASCIAAVVFVSPEPVGGWPLTLLVAFGVGAAALLMVSRLRYRSFREIDLRNRRSYLMIVPLAVAIVAIVVNPPVVLLVLSSGYVLSGPVMYLLGRRTTSSASGEVSDEPAWR